MTPHYFVVNALLLMTTEYALRILTINTRCREAVTDRRLWKQRSSFVKLDKRLYSDKPFREAALIRILVTVIVLLTVAPSHGNAATEPRVALVIGNSAYADIPLANPVNDARLMSETLRGLGFDVVEVLDADQNTMKYAIIEFGEKLDTAGKDAVGLFYYAGHGLQVGGENFLVPIGAHIKKESHVAIEAVSAGWILGEMEFAGNRMNFVVLDACRNNPLTRSFRSTTRGLARMNAPRGSLVAYSTGPGDVSSDGVGANSPYTTALARALLMPSISAERMFKQVRDWVASETGNQQVPWEESSLTGEDFFFSSVGSAGQQTEVVATTTRSTTAVQETLFWETIKDSDDPIDFEDFLATFPDSIFAGLANRRLKKLGGGQTIAALEQPDAVRNTDPAADPTATAAVDFDTGWEAYERGDFEAAYAAWHPLAEQGDIIAQYNIASMYDNGQGVAEDKSEAARWYRAAAEQGDVDAQFSLGFMYDYGEGVEQDYGEAVRWYRAAAEQGLSNAQFSLGVMYDYGEGVSEDDVEAVKWYHAAAEQDDADAQFNLAVMYDYGNGVALDDVEAVKWYRLAADQGLANAQYNLALMYDYGEGVAEDDAQAAQWYQKAVDQNHAKAQFNLALMYDYGNGVALDDSRALVLYRQAAEQENPEAQFNLAIMYDTGEGTAVDDAKAVKWYRRAAEQGHSGAQFNLGLMYDNGEGVEVNDIKAVEWYHEAAAQDHVNAQYNLALMYDYGEGVSLDDAEAVRWYLAAARQDHPAAQYNLALMYDEGEGTALDDAEAVRWYISAAELGHMDAQYNLGAMYYTGEGTMVDYLSAYMWSVIAVAQGKEEAQGNIDIIAQQMTTSQISEAKERARLWLADHGL
jgi:uncharacterized protein